MKKIILSGLVSVGFLASVALFTTAYFSDTETSTGNTLQAGTIDIAIDGENPWISKETFTLANMLPGESNTMSQTITNVGNRELVLWKQVKVTSRSDGTQSEPECTDQGGTWANPSGGCTYSGTDKNDLDSQLTYGMKVNSAYNINPTWKLKVSDIDTLWIPLGRMNPGSSLDVEQTYDFDKTAGNEYQGDQLVFDVTYYAEQIGQVGPSHTALGVVMDNKTVATEWAPIVGDGVFGLIKWDAAGNYRLRAWGLTAGSYKIRAWDAATDTHIAWVSGDVVPAGGALDFTGTHAGLTTYAGAKIWLQDSATWDNAKSLWESNLIN